MGVSPAFIVRNTFVEVQEEEEEDGPDEDHSPPFRRRRGSSFYRCASEPRPPLRVDEPCNPVVVGVEGRTARTQPVPPLEQRNSGVIADFLTDHSAASVGIAGFGSTTPTCYPGHKLAIAEPPPIWPSNTPRLVEGFPPPVDFPSDPNSAVAAAMYAGFNAGLMAAMSHATDSLDSAALASAWASTMQAQHHQLHEQTQQTSMQDKHRWERQPIHRA